VELSGTTPAQPGVPRIWRESWVPLRGADGAITAVTISVEEITERKAEERRQAYLLHLEDRLRSAPGAQEALEAACEALGQQVDALFVGVSHFDETDGTGTVDSQWRRDEQSPTVIGRHRLADFGQGRLAPLLAGDVVVVEDAAHDPRIDDPTGYEALGARSSIDVPLKRDGRVRGFLFLADAKARTWTEEEVALVRETAERAWEAAERARAEAELRDSEARFRQLAETIREVFYILEVEDGRMSYVSPAYEEVWGRPLAEIYADAKTFMVPIHPDDLPAVQANLRRLWAGEPADGVYRLVRPDGSVRYIHDRAVLTADPVSGRRRAIGLAADVTERRRIEERLQLATGAAGLGIFDVNLVTLEMEWDPRQRELWGVASDTVITDEIFQAGVHPDDRPIMQAAVARAFDPQGDGLYRAEYRICPLNGGERWIAALGRVPLEGGRALRLIGTVQDIPERPAAEAAMAESEARFRALAGTVPALIFVLDAEGSTTYVNERYSDYTGRPEADLLGTGWQDVVHPDDAPRVAQAWQHSLTTGRDYAVEGRLRRADGTWRWHLARGNPVRDATGRISQWVGAATDIDEMVETREALAASRLEIEQAKAQLEARVADRTLELRQANARLAAEIERRETAQAALVQAQKLEAVGQLTSGIAHDFNNVIAAIAGGFSVIERRTQDPRLIEVARHGAKAAERGGLLVKQLLAFARQQVLAPQACDLPALLREAEPLIARSLGPGIELSIDCPEDLCEVRIDPVQLEAALINLAVNAHDAMQGGGRFQIAARTSDPGAPDRPPELGTVPAVVLAIADTGSGISPEHLPRVVEPFFTTKPPGRGTGLGLAMVHGFVHQSGGALRIESREGEGTVVSLYLPCAGASVPEVRLARPTSADLPDAMGRAVLLVDDDGSVRGVTAAQLSDLGYEVVEASGPEEALVRLDARPDLDAVVTDVVMPGMDGATLAAEMRRRRPDLPILFMTGHADRARLIGEAVLDKPFSPQDLASALADRIGSRKAPD
jgi:PAS domain S-box-containing protein